MSRLWYKQPAQEWEEALPIGSGRLGAMVYGGTDREQVQLNEESMWYGGRVDRLNPDFKENLPLIRKYLDEGQIAKAERLMDQSMSGCPDSMHPYQTLGEIGFTFYGIDRESITGYTRSLDLDRAVVLTEFWAGDTLYRREIFAALSCALRRKGRARWTSPPGCAEVNFLTGWGARMTTELSCMETWAGADTNFPWGCMRKPWAAAGFLCLESA